MKKPEFLTLRQAQGERDSKVAFDRHVLSRVEGLRVNGIVKAIESYHANVIHGSAVVCDFHLTRMSTHDPVIPGKVPRGVILLSPAPE